MLIRLKINNFLLIDDLVLDFNKGLTVVTGETGSGKSIIIDALMILFGAKVSETIIRHGQKQAVFEAEFSLTNSHTKNWLCNNDLQDIENPTQVICRRVVDRNGHRRIYINGHGVTITQIRTLGDFILDIHTQHASITLLKSDVQQRLLDEYAVITDQVEMISGLYKKIQRLEVDLIVSRQQMHELNIKRQYLQGAIADIENAGIKPNEWHDLEVKHQQLANVNQILGELNEINDLLVNHRDDSAHSASILSSLSKLHGKLNKIVDFLPQADTLIGFVASAEVELSELRHEVNNIVNNIEQNPEALIAVEERINQLFDLSRKYRCNPENLADTLVLWQQELREIETKADSESLQVELEVAKKEYLALATKVSFTRDKLAQKLSMDITKVLNQLSIRGEFRVSLKKVAQGSFTAYGLESVEYQICFNRGMAFQPLAKAASGGELSRTALALYLILSIHNPPEVIIFDEIDVGIGGMVAANVGKMLYDLGKSKQIICITHQPQTASFGNMHLVVSKEEAKSTTSTVVKEVQNELRINEIARMLGGVEITSATLDHAREMLLMVESVQ